MEYGSLHALLRNETMHLSGYVAVHWLKWSTFRNFGTHSFVLLAREQGIHLASCPRRCSGSPISPFFKAGYPPRRFGA